MKISTNYNMQYQNSAFCGYKEAKTYASCTKLYNKYINRRLYNCNLNKLEGIQEGLKTFEGLSMKQIAFALTDLHSINMIKGCINHCLHCYANAQPFISRAPFESFKQIMDDILSLKKRIGVNPVAHRGSKYIDSFFDADSINVHLFDKDGNKHDAIELGKMIHKSTGMKTVFDTNGWDRNDKEKQKIAEDYVQKLLSKENSKHFHQINISLNPFNPKYVKAIKDGYKPENFEPFVKIDNVETSKVKFLKFKKAENDYKDYVLNESNVLFTFTPLLLKGKLGTIVRGLNKDVTNMDGCYLEDYIKTLNNILTDLELLYMVDLYGEQKIIKNEKMIKEALEKYVKLLNNNSEHLFSSGRMENFYKSRHNGSLEGIEKIDPLRERTAKNFENIKRTERVSSTDLMYLKMINSDGKVYLYDNYSIIPTDIQLKTGNEPLKTPFWAKVKDFVLTTDMIDRI